MKKVQILIILIGFTTISQGQIIISGYITDSTTGERLENANIYDQQQEKGTSSNAFGFYSLTMTLPYHRSEDGDLGILHFSLIGYQPTSIAVFPDKKQTFQVALHKGINLEELTVSDTRYERKPGEISLPIDQLNAMPALLGEKDILRSFQLLPGIQGGKRRYRRTVRPGRQSGSEPHFAG